MHTLTSPSLRTRCTSLCARLDGVRGRRQRQYSSGHGSSHRAAGSVFQSLRLPRPFHVQEYLQAADSHALDYRLLPAISLVESTCGAFERMNNRWGWDSVQSGFPSVPAGIDYITEQLAENPRYKGKTVKQKAVHLQSPIRGYVAGSKTVPESQGLRAFRSIGIRNGPLPHLTSRIRNNLSLYEETISRQAWISAQSLD